MAFVCGACRGTHASIAEARECSARSQKGDIQAQWTEGERSKAEQIADFGRAQANSYDAERKRTDAAGRRRKPTPPERRLATALRINRLGLRFRREVTISGWVVDFYCAAAKLVVEVDGRVHRSRAEMDQRRDDQLRADGYRLLRFPAHRVLEETEIVVAEIMAAADIPETHTRIARWRESGQAGQTEERPNVTIRRRRMPKTSNHSFQKV